MCIRDRMMMMMMMTVLMIMMMMIMIMMMTSNCIEAQDLKRLTQNFECTIFSTQ